MRRDSDQSVGGKILIAERIGRGIKPHRIDDGLLGKRSLTPHQTLIRSPDALADSPIAHMRTDLNDSARKIRSDHIRVRQRPKVSSIANIGVDRIDRNRMNLDQDRIIVQHRRRYLADFNALRAARISKVCRLHQNLVERFQLPNRSHFSQTR